MEKMLIIECLGRRGRIKMYGKDNDNRSMEMRWIKMYGEDEDKDVEKRMIIENIEITKIKKI